jgi:hypothetical protein
MMSSPEEVAALDLEGTAVSHLPNARPTLQAVVVL